MEWFNSFQIQCVKWGTDLFCITGNRSAGQFQTNVPFVSLSIILELRGNQRSQSERRIKCHLFLMFHLQTKGTHWFVVFGVSHWQRRGKNYVSNNNNNKNPHWQCNSSKWNHSLIRLKLLMNHQKRRNKEASHQNVDTSTSEMPSNKLDSVNEQQKKTFNSMKIWYEMNKTKYVK